MMKVPPLQTAKYAAIGYVVSWALYYIVIGFSPTAYKWWLESKFSLEHVVPLDQPDNIREAYDAYGVHNYAELNAYLQEHNLWYEVVVFRNYTDCDVTFRNKVYPRRKHAFDQFPRIDYNVPHGGNAYHNGHTKTGLFRNLTLEEMVTGGEGDYFGVSYNGIFKNEDFSDFMGAPLGTFFKDFSFISWLKQDMVTSRIHWAPIISTFCMQCYGTKYWLFWKPEDLQKAGIHMTTTVAGEIASGTPQSIVKVPTVHAVIHANDLLYFPPMAVHAAASKKGKNIMIAIRRLDLWTIYQGIVQDPANTFWMFARKLYQKIFEDYFLNAVPENSYYYDRRLRYPFRGEWTDKEELQLEAFKDFAGMKYFYGKDAPIEA